MSWRVRVQADDSFNAYRVLKESNEDLINKLEKLAGKPLVSATAFGSVSTMGIDIVCLAFSLELYIKDLFFVINGKAPRGHNIYKLYEKLPENIKLEIFNHESISQNPFHTRAVFFLLEYIVVLIRPMTGSLIK